MIAGCPVRRTRAASAPALCARNAVAASRAIRSTTMAPTLCRLPAYLGPGLPRPTISQGASSVTGPPCHAETAPKITHDAAADFGRLVPEGRIGPVVSDSMFVGGSLSDAALPLAGS